MSNSLKNNTENNTTNNRVEIFHPASGAVILLLDYLFFGAEVLAFTLPLTCALSFIISFWLIFLIQRRKAGDGIIASLLKAFGGAFVTALPTPISGTIVGTVILLLSGLDHSQKKS